MAEKDVDEQFAAIMARWEDEALGHDPYGDPERLEPEDVSSAPPVVDRPDGVNPPLPMVPPRPTERVVRPASDRPEHGDPLGTGDSRDRRDMGDRQDEAPQADDAADVELHVDLDALTDPHDPDAHYSPPPPAPLPPSEDKHFWLMVVALVGGPLLFLYLLIFDRDGNGWWMMLSLVLAIVGFVLLVLRQPLERDGEDDGVRL